MKMFRHRGFIGSVDISSEDACLFGKLLYINDLVTYEAQTVSELEVEFRKAVDDYLDTCEKLGREPMKTFKGSLNVRLGGELHKEIARRAAEHDMKINEYIKFSLMNQISLEGASVQRSAQDGCV